MPVVYASQLTCSKGQVALERLVQVLIHEPLGPEPFRLVVLGCTHVHTPTIPDDIGPGWKVIPFKGVVLDQ